MRFKAALAWLLLAAVLFAESGAALRFTWAAVYQGSDEKILAIDYASRVVRLKSGDRLRIHFQPRSRCCFYLYLHDSRKDLYLLQQREFDIQENRDIARSYTLPEGDHWYYLDENSGVELFYLIVSDRPLRRLESLTSRSLPRGAKNGNLLVNKHQMLDEIQRIIRQSSSLAEPLQKPVTVAGNFRGISEETEVRGMDVEAGSLYVRTIRLEH